MRTSQYSKRQSRGEEDRGSKDGTVCPQALYVAAEEGDIQKVPYNVLL